MAGKKRKAEAARLEETDRALYGAFRGAANSLSQLYTLAMGAQKASFHAGERHAMVRAQDPRDPASPLLSSFSHRGGFGCPGSESRRRWWRRFVLRGIGEFGPHPL